EKPRLLHLGADTDTIENANVPANLRTLLARLQANSSSLPLALRAWALHDSPGKRRPADGDHLSPLNLLQSNALHLLRSNGETGWEFDAADSTMKIFSPSPESAEGQRWLSAKNGRPAPRAEWHRFSSPVWFPVIQYTSHQDPWILIL